MSATARSVALLVTPESASSTLFGMFDLFTSVNRDWHLLRHGEPGESFFEPVLASRRKGPLTIANGVRIEVDVACNDSPLPDIICIADIFLAPDEPRAGRYEKEIAWLKHCYQQGAT